MATNQIIICVLIGIIAGAMSGLFGIGGGIIIIPALIIFMGFTQHAAQGTTLALMLPPISLLSVISYWKSGFIDVKVCVIICIGFFIGSLVGGYFAVRIPELYMKKIFGVFLVGIAIKFIFFK